MQTITTGMSAALRSGFQVPAGKLEIYGQTGILETTITDLISLTVDVAGSRKVLRTFKATIDDGSGLYSPDPDQYERNTLWYNKTAKVFLGYNTGPGFDTEELLPQGVFTIDSIKLNVKPNGVDLEISGQDQISKLIEDKFDNVYTVEDASASESNNYALASLTGSATATTSVLAGAEIQTQARIHYADTFATINGIPKKVVNQNELDSRDPIRMIVGDASVTGWRFDYTAGAGETVSQVEVEVFVDLQSAESLQQIFLEFEAGTALTDFVYTSPDNASWTSYSAATFAPSGLVRYIKFRARRTTEVGPGYFSMAVMEIHVKTASNFGPALAIDGDYYVTHWKPGITDPDPKITFNLGGSRTLNAVYLYWGNESFDFWNRVKYFLEYSTNGTTWTRIVDLNGLDESRSLFGDVEHVFNAITATHIRVSIKGRDGVCKLRHVKTVNVTATQTVDKVIKDVLAGTAITSYSIPKTRRWVKKQQADIGDDKEQFCRYVATSIGWIEPIMSENGVYTTGPRNLDPVSLAWEFTEGMDNIFSFAPLFSNDISNVILVVYKSSGAKSIIGKAVDDDPLSPTYVGKLGRRVYKYEGESYDTQDKCDTYARQKLFQRTRFKHQTSLPVTGHPAIQVDDVVLVTIGDANVENYYYLVTGFVSTFQAENAQFDTRFNISQL